VTPVCVRLYRPGDEDGIVDLLQASFPKWPALDVPVSPREHLLWKLSSSEQSLEFQVVAEAGGRIIGCRLFFVNWFNVKGERLFVRSGFDLAVFPEYRSRGVVSEMWAFARNQFDHRNDFNFGVGEHPVAVHMRVAQGNIKIANAVHILVCDALPSTTGGAEEYVIRDIDQFDERIDQFFFSATRQFDFLRARTKEYLNWRYHDVRAGRFAVKQAEDGEEVLGYVALSVARGAGQIADLLVLPGRLDVAERLIGEAIAHFRRQGLTAAECWLPEVHPYRETLVRSGFAHKRRVVPLSYRYLRAPQEKLEFLHNARASLHIMAGDTDLV
jgi:ribosomal protein S18 acetylase RimI-like enzyme